ncbi:Membrane-associated zinc metalloprotease [Desulfamplus magnetovallimortis]|uniref:Zinc metalloprotease n=1 Tax=Desulfamplus magnetovallimortis TaxID=1246637 RepID=A0A1W1H4H0_9BACT|nr:RIP metalloprotease RseP [Desulfamplus magnetovallimortis]SLM27371.1 Membrane-associated zinc metalloprotease [Desulfamplus magnetovallimortis]
MGHSIIAFIIVLGILVFFHELGHFLLARYYGVGVVTFSLGFGPKIYKKNVGLTEYCISLIPLGGYVKMVGEEPGEPIRFEDIDISFSQKPLFQKAMIVAAGPLFNFILAFLLFYFIALFSGLYVIKPVVGKVAEDTPAHVAGIQSGDTITGVHGEPVTSWEDMVNLIGNSNGDPLELLVAREGREFTVMVTPEEKIVKNLFGEDKKKYMIGIAAKGDILHIPLNPFQAVGEAVKRTWQISHLTILSVVKIVQGTVPADTLGGPIMIAQMAGEQAKAGVASLSFFIAMLSVNLGIINLFPIPVLDGGHLLFFAIEGITGITANESIREKANQIGIALLVALMVFVFYNDIIRIFNGG